MSTYGTTTEGSTAIPRHAASIGIDGEAATHYLENRITNDGLLVFVEEVTGEVGAYDLAETPCLGCGDPIEAWIGHVAKKRGEWERETSNEGLIETLTAGLEGGAYWPTVTSSPSGAPWLSTSSIPRPTGPSISNSRVGLTTATG